MMTLRAAVGRMTQQEELNFLITNRLPRRLATRFMGWFSRIEQPLVRGASIRLWRLFCDVELGEARKERFASLHDCFVRELREGARPFDPDLNVVASPCDAIVGACGSIDGDRLYQVKGMDYRLVDLLGDPDHAALYRDGCFATLRLTAGMYHHFHAPHDLALEAVRYIAGDLWNVNPPALKRIEKLYCRNERAAVRGRLAGGEPLTLVAVAAILVGGLRLPFLGVEDLRDGGTRTLPTDARFAKGEKVGWFEHGSTIILFAPAGFRLATGIGEGTRIKAGEALMLRS
jgi:phosphatidylserine decarboxylase